VERNPNEEYPYGLRGGSWGDGDPEHLRVAFRGNYYPDYRYYVIGFRVGAPATEAGLST
jgi:formylglycine-generating enzyme required for sulfatase activity